MPITSPPLKPDGSVAPHDHAEIAAVDVIIRRVAVHHIVSDADGRRRISSMLYEPSDEPDGGMSIDIEKLIAEAGKDPREYVTSEAWPGSVSLTAKQLRDAGLQVGFDPLEENPFHGEVWGKFTRGTKKRLQREAQWYVAVPDVFTA